MKKNIFLSVIIIAMILFLSPLAVQALELTLSQELPCPPGLPGGCPTEAEVSTDISSYIKRVYQFGVGISGILAVGMIVAGAIYYSVSAGSPDKQNDAKSMITSALWGVALLLGSFLILRTINPQLVKLEKPELEREVPQVGYTLASATCPVKTNTGCFFNVETGEACDLDDPGEVCDSRDTSTAACIAEDAPAVCNCTDCRIVSTIIPVKEDLCSGSTLAKCLLQDWVLDTIRETRILNPNFTTYFPNVNKWRIVEAFPPNIPHVGKEHYNGNAFDVAPASGSDPSGCVQALPVARLFINTFQTVIIKRPAGECAEIPITIEDIRNGISILEASGSEAFHVHIAHPR